MWILYLFFNELNWIELNWRGKMRSLWVSLGNQKYRQAACLPRYNGPNIDSLTLVDGRTKWSCYSLSQNSARREGLVAIFFRLRISLEGRPRQSAPDFSSCEIFRWYLPLAMIHGASEHPEIENLDAGLSRVIGAGIEGLSTLSRSELNVLTLLRSSSYNRKRG